MSGLPKIKIEEKRIENRARKLAPLCFTDDWIHKEETGDDFGRDMIMEYTENGYAVNEKISLQIKARTKLVYINNNEAISFPLAVRTIEYALRERIAFLLFLYDAEMNTMYYLNIQEYMSQKDENWRNNDYTYNVHIPLKNIACPEANEIMINYAKNKY